RSLWLSWSGTGCKACSTSTLVVVESAQRFDVFFDVISRLPVLAIVCALLISLGCVVAVSFFFSSRRRHTRLVSDWSSDVCSSDLAPTTVADMVKSVDRGVLVTRFWYVRFLEPQRISITGLTRDGTFLIEGGQVRRDRKSVV